MGFNQHYPAQGLAGSRAGLSSSADWMSPRITEFKMDFYTLEIGPLLFICLFIFSSGFGTRGLVHVKYLLCHGATPPAAHVLGGVSAPRFYLSVFYATISEFLICARH